MNAPARYRSRHLTVTAIQWTGDNPTAVMDFLSPGTSPPHHRGQWLIRTDDDTYHSCDPGLFEALFQPVRTTNVNTPAAGDQPDDVVTARVRRKRWDIHLRLPEDIHARLTAAADQRALAINKIVAAAITAYLDELERTNS